MGVLSEASPVIILKDPDGNLYEAYADYARTLTQAALDWDGAHVQAVTCPGILGDRQAIYATRPPAPPDAATPSPEPSSPAPPPAGTAEGAPRASPGGGLIRGSPDEEGLQIRGLGHIYVVHFEPLRERRAYLEGLFFRRWGLDPGYVTFVTWCDSRKTPQATIDRYYWPTVACMRERGNQSNPLLTGPSDPKEEPLGLSRRLLGIEFGRAQACTAISHYDSLRDMLEQGYETALVLEDDAVFDEAFPDLLQEYLSQMDPDWGVLFTDAATSCHWWEYCWDLLPKRPVPTVYRRSFPGGSFGGAIMWHRRGARALVSTFVPFCIPWDMEIEYHFKVHNVSVFFASPSLIAQGTFLNPDEKGYATSSLLGERTPDFVASFSSPGPILAAGPAATIPSQAPVASPPPPTQDPEEPTQEPLGTATVAAEVAAAAAAAAAADPGCKGWSFFDCHAERPWAECVAMRRRCGG